MEDDNPVTAAIKARGADFIMANDIARTWTTGAQAFLNEQSAMLVFREQNLLQDPESGKLDAVVKNVASLVMPLEVAIQLYKMLGEQLTANGHIKAE